MNGRDIICKVQQYLKLISGNDAFDYCEKRIDIRLCILVGGSRGSKFSVS